MSEESPNPGERWFQSTDPIIDDLIVGLEIGFYQPSECDDIRDVVAKKLRDLWGYQGPAPPLDHYSLVVGHVLGQAVERMRRDRIQS